MELKQAVEVLTNRNMLRAGLRELSGAELGVVLALTLRRLDQLGTMKLSEVLEELTQRVREEEARNPPWGVSDDVREVGS